MNRDNLWCSVSLCIVVISPYSFLDIYLHFKLSLSITICQSTYLYLSTYPSVYIFIYLPFFFSAGCTGDAETDPCAIDMITHSLGTISHYESYNSWRVGDTRLDWMGAQAGQGDYFGMLPSGTPLAWTTNNVLSPAYQELNT